MKQQRKPIVFINGDGGVGRVAPMVLQTLFSGFPTVDVPMDVQARLRTDDDCINHAVQQIQQLGAGFKNSTASNDPAIVRAGMKSANIVMRRKLGVYAVLRMLHHAVRYDARCGVLRYGHGGFYDEQSCEIVKVGDKDIAVIQQALNLSDLTPFAALAAEVSRAHCLDLILASKSTISESEKLFRDRIEQTWQAIGGIEWEHKLTDIGLAELAVQTARGGAKAGNFLFVADNPNGDSASDIVDHQNGDFMMGSEVHCIDSEGNLYAYHELPGGTADAMATGELQGSNFLNPAPIIFGLAAAFEQVNPADAEYFTRIRKATLEYLALNSDPVERHTERMLEFVAEKVELPAASAIMST